MRHVIILTTILSLGVQVGAQTITPIESGSRVRIQANGESTIGTVTRTENTTVFLAEYGDQSWNLDGVDRLDVSIGSTRNTMRGLLLGFLGGIVLGAIAQGFVDDSENTIGMSDARVAAFYGTWGAATIGGAVLGVSTKSDTWEKVYPKTTSLLVVPQPRVSHIVSLSLRF